MAPRLAAWLRQRFDDAARPGWPWFEDALGYDNPRLPQALARYAAFAECDASMEIALRSLAWLCDIQRAPGGHLRPVGTGSFGAPHTPPAAFDQQPLEAAAQAEACATLYEATGNALWLHEARRALDWFTGANDLGEPLVDAETGRCFDGLTRIGANRNTGAESVLAWPAALLALRRAEAMAPPLLLAAE